jgi:hypothetical protein
MPPLDFISSENFVFATQIELTCLRYPQKLDPSFEKPIDAESKTWTGH